jgi:DNA-directed RNA polymerase specialized sigma24 family protein
MLDLARHHEDVRRLTWRHPLFRVAVELGHDADDVMQEVMLRLLRRQQGRSAFDVSRGSMSNYVHLSVGSIVANYIRDHHADLEVVDHEQPDEGRADLGCDPGHHLSGADVVEPLIESLGLDAVHAEILRRLARGDGRHELTTELGLPKNARKVRAVLRMVSEWAVSAV